MRNTCQGGSPAKRFDDTETLSEYLRPHKQEAGERRAVGDVRSDHIRPGTSCYFGPTEVREVGRTAAA